MNRSILSVAAVLVLASTAFAQEKISFQIKYVPGTYVTTVKTQTDRQVGGTETATQTAGMVVVQEMVIGKPTDKGQQIRITHRRMQQALKGGPLEFSYDSAEPTANDSKNPMAIIGRIVDVPIDVTLDANGKVTDVRGLDDVLDKIAKENAPLAKQMKNDMAGRIKEQFSQSARMLPDKPVAVGDTWENVDKQDITGGAAVEFKTTFKLKKIEFSGGHKVAVIEITGATKITGPDKSPKTGQPATTEATGGIKQQGTLKINIATGQIEESDITQEMTATKIVAGKEVAVKSQTRTLQTTKEGKYRAK